MTQAIIHKYQELFNSEPMMIRSPGRINLIGEHTDYNLGFVLPAAIDKEIEFAIGTNHTQTVNLYAADVDQHYSFELDQIQRSTVHWANYIIGSVDQIQKKGHELAGFDCVFGGNIPLGAGMSSSAAIEGGVIFGLSQLFSLDLSRLEMARMGQAAEWHMVGVQCGLMDQYANMFGKEGYLLQMDCREETHIEIPADLDNYGLWLFNSNVKHSLGESEYNVRRSECETGVANISKHHSGISSLRDCTVDLLASIDDPIIYQRCLYVVEENQRVVQAAKDLANKDLTSFGKRMYQSHYGLSNQYQVSCQELDLLVDLTSNEVSVLGARMMGGGFGGCTINLIHKDAVESVSTRIANVYKQRTGKDMGIYAVNIAHGTSVSNISVKN